MQAKRESRATLMSGSVDWIVAIGMVLALAGASFAALPSASAQDGPTPTPTRGSVSVTRALSVRVDNGTRLCPRGADRAALVHSGAYVSCRRLGDGDVTDIRYSPYGRSYFGEMGYLPTSAEVRAGHLAVTYVVDQPWDAPRVFCSQVPRTEHYVDKSPDTYDHEYVEFFPIAAHSPGSSTTTYTITMDNPAYTYVECLWVFASADAPAIAPAAEPTAMPPVQVTPPVQNPDIIVTPVAPIQLPTSTPTMPRLEVTPPAQIPDPIDTPVVQLPTPTPSPEIGEPPVIVITPAIPYPIEIVTPIVPIVPVIPVVPTEEPALIRRAPGQAMAST